MHSKPPDLSANRRENRGGYHRRRPEIRPQLLDGERLCLHHGEEGAYSPERILSLFDRGRLYCEEPYAIRSDDEEIQFPGSSRQGVCAGARSRHRVHAHRDCQVQAGGLRYGCQRQEKISAGSSVHSHAEHRTSHRRVTGPD